MKRMLFAALAAATAVISSCTDQEETLHDSFSPLQVSVSGEDASRTLEQGPAFPAGSRLGVSLFAADGAPYEGRSDGYLNVPYEFRSQTGSDGSASGIWNSDIPIRLSPAAGKAIAYYPYSASVTDIHAIPVDVTKSQTDYMYSDWETGVSATAPWASFTMRHALTAVEVRIRRDGYDGVGLVSAIRVSSPQLGTSGRLDATTGSLSAVTGIGQPVSASIETPFAISPAFSSTSILAVPAGTKQDLTVQVTLDGKDYAGSVTAPEAFAQGMVYAVSLLAKAGDVPLSVDGVTVNPWGESVLQNPEMVPDEFTAPDQYVVKIEIPNDGYTFKSNVYGFTGVIDWGDGETSTLTGANNPSHVYTTKGEYFVTAKGKCSKLSSGYNGSYATSSCILDILYIGGNMGVKSMDYAFKSASKMKFLRKGIFDQLTIVTDFRYTFEGCSSLTSIPQGLFDQCTKVYSFERTFYGCSKLESIPEGLFDQCTHVTSFNRTFSGCSGLTSIPQGLFDKCTQVAYFEGTFSGCKGLTSIPQGLFDHCTKVTSFAGTFEECSGLTSIPNGLFDKCTEVTNFGSTSFNGSRNGTFERCSGLRSIPEGLFDKCTKVTSFWETFSGCSGLQSIPNGLFDKCTKVTSFNRTFYGCRSLQSIPQGLFDQCTQVTSFLSTFEGCRELTSIPAGLFDHCTQVTSFLSTFEGCRELTSIPQGLFDYCTLVTGFEWTFQDCQALRSIQQGLFDKCTEVTSFKETFYGCSELKSVPQGLFDHCTQVTTFEGTFKGCLVLQSIPAGLFDKCTQVTSFNRTFSGCRGLTSIPQGLFDYCTLVTGFEWTFEGCRGLQGIPHGLFDHCTLVTGFEWTFGECSGLKSIPAGLFDHCTKVTSFEWTFGGCSGLTGESPYTDIRLAGGTVQRVHLYERGNYPDHFKTPTSYGDCFYNCRKLSDYNQIPTSWGGGNPN